MTPIFRVAVRAVGGRLSGCRSTITGCVVVAIAATAGSAGAQADPAAAPATPALPPPAATRDDSLFVERVRAATARYQDLSAAVADGFRKVGPDLPTLGEHWVHLARIATGGSDPLEPPVLIYIRIGGRPVLAGVAYTALLGPAEPYPSAPVPAEHWHEHNGSVEDEILTARHARHADDGAPVRLAVAHAWIWIPNPAGVWVADNPELPRRRQGGR